MHVVYDDGDEEKTLNFEVEEKTGTYPSLEARYPFFLKKLCSSSKTISEFSVSSFGRV